MTVCARERECREKPRERESERENQRERMYRESFSTYQGTSRCVLGASRHITHFELSLSVQGLLLLVNPSGSISTRPGAAAGAPGAAPGAQWSAAGERSVVSIARALAAARSSYHISRSVWNSPELFRTSRLLEIDSCSSIAGIVGIAGIVSNCHAN